MQVGVPYSGGQTALGLKNLAVDVEAVATSSKIRSFAERRRRIAIKR